VSKFVSRLAFALGSALIVTAVVAGGAVLRPAAFPSVARAFRPALTELQFVVSSDAHYGLTRATFRGQRNVDAHVVNAALVATMNTLPDLRFPLDSGLSAGQRIGVVDFVVEAGDVTNRQEHNGELTVQGATASWAQFAADYLDGIRLTDHSGARVPIYVVPGNHEGSNAVGFYRTMRPSTDPTPLIEIYNRMLAPAQPKTVATFDYLRDRVFYTRDIGGIHFVFLHIWPDSAMRARIERDLLTVRTSTPVVIFAHDQPDVEAKHFINPNGTHDVNAADQFENLLADRFADGPSVDMPSLVEQSQFEELLRQHPNVTAYFHGNSNWHQAYEWSGPHRSARLHTFRVDSPMKGAVSSLDETKLSFEIVTIDLVLRTMTVRECLWNADPARPEAPAAWGDAVTVTLDPRPTPKSIS
jgi:hypothetical protein